MVTAMQETSCSDPDGGSPKHGDADDNYCLHDDPYSWNIAKMEYYTSRGQWPIETWR